MSLINTLSKDASVNRSNFSSGLMPPEAAKKFIQMIFNSTPLFQSARTITMDRDPVTLAGILEQKGQLRQVGINNPGNQSAKDSEDQSAYRRSMSAYSFQIASKEFSLSRTVSNKTLQENIEGQSLGQIVAQNLSEMVRVDLEDAFINAKAVDPTGTATATLSNAPGTGGTTFQVGATQPAGFPVDGSKGHGYLRIDKGGVTELCTYNKLVNNAGTWEFQNVVRLVTDQDGIITSTAISLAIADTIKWYKNSLLGGMNGVVELFKSPQALTSTIVDGSVINSGAISFDHFQAMIRALAKKYRVPELVFVLSPDQMLNYRNWLMVNHGISFAGDIIKDPNFSPLMYKAITPVEWPNDLILLTNPQNLVVGIHEAIHMRKITAETDSKLADTNETYWNVRLQAGFGVERPDASVLLTGLV